MVTATPSARSARIASFRQHNPKRNYMTRFWSCEVVSADFSDADMHWRLDPSAPSLLHCPSQRGLAAPVDFLCFGLKAAPLLRRSLSAVAAWMLQCLLPSRRFRSQVYLEDERCLLLGRHPQREEMLSLLILIACALGHEWLVTQANGATRSYGLGSPSSCIGKTSSFC